MDDIRIDNGKAFAWFYGSIILTMIGLTFCITLIADSEASWIHLLPYGVFGIISILLLVFRPNYVAFEINSHRIAIFQGLNSDEPFSIFRTDYAGYELTASMNDRIHAFVAYRKVERGYLKSREIRLALFSSGQIVELKNALAAFKLGSMHPHPLPVPKTP